MPGLFKVAMNISVWVVDRDLGVSRGYQYDDEDRIEDAEEVVKNDNEEDNYNYQAIKCLDFLKSQAQVELNDDDDKDEDEDVEVKDDNDDNEEYNEDEDDDINTIKSK